MTSIIKATRSLTLTLALTLALPLIPSPARAQYQAVPAAVAACAAQPEICAIAAVGVGAWYVLWRNQATELCTWGGCRALQQPSRITDPENDPGGELSDEPILANSPEEADRVCRRKAEAYGLDMLPTKRPYKIRPGQPQQYRCNFRRRMH